MQVLLAEGWGLEGCAAKVSTQYETLIGMEQPSAILGFMTIAEQLPQYGVNYFVRTPPPCTSPRSPSPSTCILSCAICSVTSISAQEVKDKKGMPWLLGVGYSGVAQYYFSDNSTPRQVRPAHLRA